MAVCLSCMVWDSSPVCAGCRSRMEAVAPARLSGGLHVIAAFAHTGAARVLVHRLKYAGIAAAGEVFSSALADRLPIATRALVPVPRSAFRRIRYGTDPAVTLARQIASRTGLAVVPALRPALWWPAHAGSGRSGRRSPSFALIRPVPEGSVLVDDVLTTGATLSGAALVSGIRTAVTATRAGGTGSG